MVAVTNILGLGNVSMIALPVRCEHTNLFVRSSELLSLPVRCQMSDGPFICRTERDVHLAGSECPLSFVQTNRD
jgi:hypothetical protein